MDNKDTISDNIDFTFSPTIKISEVVRKEIESERLASSANQNEEDFNPSLQAARYLHQQKMLEQVQTEMDQKRAEFETQMKVFQERRNELKDKNMQFEERQQKFEKFLKENEAKKQKAVLKAQTERKLAEEKQIEINAAQENIREIQHKLESTNNTIIKWKIYEEFMEDVLKLFGSSLENSSDLQIRDVIMRYETLYDCQQELKSHLNSLSVALDGLRKKMKDETNRISDTVFQLTSEQSRLHVEYEKKLAKVSHINAKIADLRSHGIDQMRELAELFLAIDNLHQKVLNPLNSSHFNRPGTGQTKGGIKSADNAQTQAEKMIVIRDRLLDLMAIASKAKKLTKEAEATEKTRKQNAIESSASLNELRRRSTIGGSVSVMASMISLRD